MLKTTATTTTFRDRHTMAPIVLTALWRLCLLAAAITQTRSIIIKGAFNHPRPSSTRVVINWSRSQSPRITHSAWRPNWPRPAARATPQHAPAITRADKFFRIAAKPLAAVLLNQLRAPLFSNMAVWDGAVTGAASTRSRLRNLRRIYQMTQIGWVLERQLI